MNGLAIAFQNETKARINKDALHEACSLILRRLNRVGRVEIELIVTGDTKIKTLNKQYRQIDKPTDVLSFPATVEHVGEGRAFIGSIIISADTAAKQAAQAGIPLETELKTLAGHGLLHLLGYHHR